MAKHPAGEYGVWTIPGTSFAVSYWLSLFHEIDFHVNEGFRRIPHGGVETGGLLFGTTDAASARVEAFRSIECEHSRGPSFLLSERDLERLREQISGAAADPELHGLDVIGFFIAHTRSDLKLNDRDLALFDEFFPAPGKLLVLVKPERFQPTRFAFLVRGPGGQLQGDTPENAIILPGAARDERTATGPMPAIPAPAAKMGAAPRAPRPAPEPLIPVSPARTELAQPVSPSAAAPPPVTERVPPSPPPSAIPAAAQNLPSVEEIRRRRSEAIREADPFASRSTHRELAQSIRRQGRRSNARLAIVLFIAAALGCVVGYFIYLQLPPAVIPLNVHKRLPALIVTWPAEQTRDAVYAALRIDDGDPIPLSSQQRAEGQVTIRAAGGNVKIELIARHWMRDSRGILRYVEPPLSSAASAPTASQ